MVSFPSIFILQFYAEEFEATASLVDNKKQRKIRKMIENSFNNRTGILIALK